MGPRRWLIREDVISLSAADPLRDERAWQFTEGQRYLLGDRITEADWRLFTTLVRFDTVYYVHVKCNLRRILDYPNLWPYLRDLYPHPGVAETVDMDHIKRHYHLTHDKINPSGLVPDGPELDFDAPHTRGQRG